MILALVVLWCGVQWLGIRGAQLLFFPPFRRPCGGASHLLLGHLARILNFITASVTSPTTILPCCVAVHPYIVQATQPRALPLFRTLFFSPLKLCVIIRMNRASSLISIHILESPTSYRRHCHYRLFLTYNKEARTSLSQTHPKSLYFPYGPTGQLDDKVIDKGDINIVLIFLNILIGIRIFLGPYGPISCMQKKKKAIGPWAKLRGM